MPGEPTAGTDGTLGPVPTLAGAGVTIAGAGCVDSAGAAGMVTAGAFCTTFVGVALGAWRTSVFAGFTGAAFAFGCPQHVLQIARMSSSAQILNSRPFIALLLGTWTYGLFVPFYPKKPSDIYVYATFYAGRLGVGH